MSPLRQWDFPGGGGMVPINQPAGVGGGDGTEPIFNAGTNTTHYFESFDSYTNVASFQAGGWATNAAVGALVATAPGMNGSAKSAQLNWTLGGADVGMDRGVPTAGQPRICHVTFYYKADANWLGDSVGRKWFIINLGESDRITCGQSMAGPVGDGRWEQNISGVFVDQDTWVRPTNPFEPKTVAEHIQDGLPHRITMRRTDSSPSQAANGIYEMWVDGYRVFNITGRKFNGNGIITLEVANTWNNGTPQNQTEWYDEIRVWS